VEDTIRGRALIVVATTGPNGALPAVMEGLERIDASPDRVGEAVKAIVERFEEKGLRGLLSQPCARDGCLRKRRYRPRSC